MDYTWSALDKVRQEIMLITLAELVVYHENAEEECNDNLASCDSKFSPEYVALAEAGVLHRQKARAFRNALAAYNKEG